MSSAEPSRTGSRGTKVLVVDDSAVMRTVMLGILQEDPTVASVQVAADPLIAVERMRTCWPDVIVLDLEMPRMDGLTFLRRIMIERPTPVVICSTLTQMNASVTVEALAIGAVAVVSKPQLGLKQFLSEKSGSLLDTIRSAAGAKVRRLPVAGVPERPRSRIEPGSVACIDPRADLPINRRTDLRNDTRTDVSVKYSADAVLAPPDGMPLKTTTDRIVAIGTSTGGTQALERVLTQLPRVCPGLLIVQHMPEKFTAVFAARLASLCQIAVTEAQGGERVIAGRALIAPGGKHILLRRSGAQYYVDVVDGPPVNRHKPSVDVLFRSVAKCAGANALGIIMTGMGDDGAAGLLEMRRAGADTVAQDEASCVVYGMPKEAVKRDAVCRSTPLDGIAQEIIRAGARPYASPQG